MSARLVKARLDAELIGNVSIKVNNTDRPDTWEVQGRGELALAILSCSASTARMATSGRTAAPF